MNPGRGRIVGVAAGSTALALLIGAIAVWGGSRSGHQSAAEINELGSLPEGLTPLDPANPNPTGDDPLAIGTPPEIESASSPDAFLARAEQLREAASATSITPARAEPAEPDPGPDADEDSLLVTFAAGTASDAITAALDAAGVSGTPIEGTDVVAVDTTGQDQAAVAAALEDVEAVDAVGPNLIRRIAKLPNDSQLGTQQPYLDTVHAPAAWDVADTGSSVTVAVLDTGADLDHPDLVPNLVAGRDIVNNDAVPADDNGHGTQVAGIVGAATNNGVGVAGMAWNAKIMPVKVLDAAGDGNDADVANGIIWATNHGADVINLSLGGAGTTDALDAALTYAQRHDVVVVAAAGNASARYPFHPAAAAGVIGVTATDAAGRFAWFSNHGPWYSLAAPGIDVPSTALAPGAAVAYAPGTGTSFSSPIVAGVVALVRERHPGWAWTKVLYEVVRTARDAGPAGMDDAYGFGIVDAAAALGVNPLGAVSQPDLAGDAGNVPSTPRSIAVGSAASETIGYEYDEDWFAFDVPATAGATITVTPPAALADGYRAAEMDPIVQLYGPGGGLVATVDDTLWGETEQLRINVSAGRNTLRITSYGGSASPATYTVQVDLDAELAGAWVPWQSVFSVDSFAEAVAVADFDGDGRDDVALTTGYAFDAETDFQLFVLTQAPDGSLEAPERLATHASYPGTDPLTAADLDGDGDTDLARGVGAGLDVSWNQDGTLSPPVLYPVDGPVSWAQAAGLDGTGATELVVSDEGDAAPRVLRWTGSAFTAQSLPGVPLVHDIGTSMAVADLTGDGRPDVATFGGSGYTNASGVNIYAQEADGTWSAPVNVDFPNSLTNARTLGAGDISNDGRADLVALTYGSTPELTYRVQQADGTFGPPVTLPAAGRAPSMRFDDVNGDGLTDLAMRHGSEIGVHLQTDGGTLAPRELVPTPNYTSDNGDSLAIGDVDSDGINDLVIADYSTGLDVIRHRATEGAGPWVAATVPTAHATEVATSVRPSVTFGRDVAPSSVNADTLFLTDGRTGVVVEASVARSGRTATLTPSVPLAPGVPYQVWVLGVTDSAGTETAFERFAFTTAAGARPSYSVNGTYRPVRGDLDGNGYDDIFWYAPGAVRDPIWLFGPSGRVNTSTSVNGTYTPVVGDFNGNGYHDIFWYAPGSGTDVMWWNSQTGFSAAVVPVSGVYVPVVGDFDRNGYDDILWYGPGSAGDSIWYFSASGRRSVVQTVRGTTYRPAAGDFTRDGHADILWYAPGPGGDSLWRGSTTGFVPGATVAISGGYLTRTLDFNADGFQELFLYATDKGIFLRGDPSGLTSVQVGPGIPSGGRPVTGDFTGDLRDDLFSYVPGTVGDTFYRGTPTGVG